MTFAGVYTNYVKSNNAWASVNSFKFDNVDTLDIRKLNLPADLVTFAEEILNGKLHFLCSAACTHINPFLTNVP